MRRQSPPNFVASGRSPSPLVILVLGRRHGVPCASRKRTYSGTDERCREFASGASAVSSARKGARTLACSMRPDMPLPALGNNTRRQTGDASRRPSQRRFAMDSHVSAFSKH